jgi:hypothetical protein
MAIVSPIKRYKQKLVSSLINSPELISLIDNSYVKNGKCVETENLIYKRIFPFYYIPETVTETDAYVIMKVNGLGKKGKIYSKAEVYICVISHQNFMYVKNGDGTRIDMMGEIVESLFDGRDDFGFGEMELESDIETEINSSHRCRILRFIVEDFNSDACRDEPISIY